MSTCYTRNNMIRSLNSRQTFRALRTARDQRTSRQTNGDQLRYHLIKQMSTCLMATSTGWIHRSPLQMAAHPTSATSTHMTRCRLLLTRRWRRSWSRSLKTSAKLLTMKAFHHRQVQRITNRRRGRSAVPVTKDMTSRSSRCEAVVEEEVGYREKQAERRTTRWHSLHNFD